MNLSIHFEYDGINEVFFCDGTCLVISHTSSLALSTPTKIFYFHYTLRVLNIHKNLIFVYYFIKQNIIFVEFHPFYFLVKDQATWVTLLRGVYENGV